MMAERHHYTVIRTVLPDDLSKAPADLDQWLVFALPGGGWTILPPGCRAEWLPPAPPEPQE